jgi:uncharacterized membrane protein
MRLGRTAWIYGFFNTWGVVGTLLVALGATSGPRVLVAAGLVLLSVTLLDVAVLFPILRARRDLRRRRSSDDSI